MFGGKIGVPELMIVTLGLVFLALFIFAWSRIFAKAGYSPILCLLMLIPGVSLIAFLWFAFSKWPILKSASGTPQSGA
ncbi:MAG TPA: hypothetical protein VKL40_10680 [Candidatus Angelobacter sp.]|nr:hypothetical protein [Candidatus Angelobacter sp.]